MTPAQDSASRFVVLGAMGWTAGARHAKAHVVHAAGLAALLIVSIALHAIGARSLPVVFAPEFLDGLGGALLRGVPGEGEAGQARQVLPDL